MDTVVAEEVLMEEAFSQDDTLSSHEAGDERVRVVVVRTSHHLSHVAPDTPKPAALEATVVGRPRTPTTTPSASSPSSVDVAVRRRARLIWAFSIIALVLGVGTLAAVGPTFKILLRDGVPPVRAAAWRAQAQLVFILPLSALELLFTPAAERSAILRRPNALAALANGLAWGIEMAIWVIALEYTTSARASLFSSLDPFMLMAWMSLRGQAVSKGELWGCAVAFLGLLITCADAFVGADGFFSNATHLIGDAMCILVSAIIVIEVVSSRESRQHVRLFTYSAAINIIFCLTVSACSVLLEGGGWHASQPEEQLWGWIHPEYFGMVSMFGLAVGVVGIASFYFAVKYVNPLLCTLIGLAQPGLAAILGWALRTDGPPSMSTILGGLVLVVATAMVGYYDDKRSRAEAQREEEEAAAALAALTVVENGLEAQREEEAAAALAALTVVESGREEQDEQGSVRQSRAKDLDPLVRCGSAAGDTAFEVELVVMQ